MEICRINDYDDPRFSHKVLMQHGCFLVDSEPYEIEIISEFEAIIRGDERCKYHALIEEFRFYAPHISSFLDANGTVYKEYKRANIINIPLEMIQPSQFYVDMDKISAISSFIDRPDDIIIQIMPYEGRYISLDGHTRLYYAVMNDWKYVRAVVESVDESILGFAAEARKRKIYTPYDLMPVTHAEYEILWNKFCDDYFAERNEKEV